MKVFKTLNLLVLVLALAAVISCRANSSQICFNSSCFTVELAQKPSELLRGLQFRKEMAEKNGMLFIFPVSGKYNFWMKDTLIALDMIWLDSGYRVVYIEKNVSPCKSDPCPVYGPQEEALYVLEINSGLCDKLNIKAGDRARFIAGE